MADWGRAFDTRPLGGELVREALDDRRFDKTKICKFFLKGQCKRGQACTFAHGAHQLRAQPDLFKTQMCIDFVASGRCQAGSGCRFAHSPEEVRPPAVADVGHPTTAPAEPPAVPAHMVSSQIEMMQQQVFVLHSALQRLQMLKSGEEEAGTGYASRSHFSSQSTDYAEASVHGVASPVSAAAGDDAPAAGLRAPPGMPYTRSLGCRPPPFGLDAPAFIEVASLGDLGRGRLERMANAMPASLPLPMALGGAWA